MVFFYRGQTGRNGSVQNDQPNQRSTVCSVLYYHGRSTGEPTVRLVRSVRSDPIKEQALSLWCGSTVFSQRCGCRYLLWAVCSARDWTDLEVVNCHSTSWSVLDSTGGLVVIDPWPSRTIVQRLEVLAVSNVRATCCWIIEAINSYSCRIIDRVAAFHVLCLTHSSGYFRSKVRPTTPPVSARWRARCLPVIGHAPGGLGLQLQQPLVRHQITEFAVGLWYL